MKFLLVLLMSLSFGPLAFAEVLGKMLTSSLHTVELDKNDSSIQGVTHASIAIEVAAKIVTLRLYQQKGNCPKGKKCAKGMAKTIEIEQTLTYDKTNSCGVRVLKASDEEQGISLTILDNSKNHCDTDVELYDTEVTLDKEDGYQSKFYGEALYSN